MKTLLLTLALTLGAVTATANPPLTPGFQEGFGLAAMFAKLDLSEDQKRSIATTLRDNRGAIEQAIRDVAAAREDLMVYVQSDVYDEAAVKAAYAEVAAAGESAVLLRARLTADIRSQLTAEQVGTLDDFRENRKTRVRGFLSIVRERIRNWIDAKAAG